MSGTCLTGMNKPKKNVLPLVQNVNKVSSAVQLRFDVLDSVSLPAEVKPRLVKLAGNRVTDDGMLILEAKRFRTQEANRQDALERLLDLVTRAQHVPRPRHKTRPTAASRRRRLDSKRRHGQLKRQRRNGVLEE